MDIPAVLQKLVSLATLIPMLLHSILGCCWHHVHCGIGKPQSWQVVSCEHHSGNTGARTQERKSRCDHQSTIVDNRDGATCDNNCPSPADHQRTPNDPCREERCVYVGFPPSELPKLDLATGFACTSEIAVHLPSSMATFCSHLHGEQSPQTLLSARARTQVWLI